MWGIRGSDMTNSNPTLARGVAGCLRVAAKDAAIQGKGNAGVVY